MTNNRREINYIRTGKQTCAYASDLGYGQSRYLFLLRVSGNAVAGQWTFDSWVAGSSPGGHHCVVASVKLLIHLCASVTKQYNLVPAKGVISLAGKVTTGLVESNGSRVYD